MTGTAYERRRRPWNPQPLKPNQPASQPAHGCARLECLEVETGGDDLPELEGLEGEAGGEDLAVDDAA